MARSKRCVRTVVKKKKGPLVKRIGWVRTTEREKGGGECLGMSIRNQGKKRAGRVSSGGAKLCYEQPAKVRMGRRERRPIRGSDAKRGD